MLVEGGMESLLSLPESKLLDDGIVVTVEAPQEERNPLSFSHRFVMCLPRHIARIESLLYAESSKSRALEQAVDKYVEGVCVCVCARACLFACEYFFLC